MSALRSFLKWARTVPGNLASLRPHFDACWTHGRVGLGVCVDHNFDPGDAHYWLHFSWIYLVFQIGPFELAAGIKDSN